MISAGYLEQNKLLHAENPKYGIKGGMYAEFVIYLAGEHGCDSILDYGCGKGKLAERIGGNLVRNYDPAVDKWSAPPVPADMVVCVDVMEHVEPEYIDDVLAHIARLTRKIAFFAISTTPAQKMLPDGRNTHLSIYPPDWWHETIKKRFEVLTRIDTADGWVSFICW